MTESGWPEELALRDLILAYERAYQRPFRVSRTRGGWGPGVRFVRACFKEFKRLDSRTLVPSVADMRRVLKAMR